MASIEQLYKDFGVLADAKDKAGEVRINSLLETKNNCKNGQPIFLAHH